MCHRLEDIFLCSRGRENIVEFIFQGTRSAVVVHNSRISIEGNVHIHNRSSRSISNLQVFTKVMQSRTISSAKSGEKDLTLNFIVHQISFISGRRFEP